MCLCARGSNSLNRRPWGQDQTTSLRAKSRGNIRWNTTSSNETISVQSGASAPSTCEAWSGVTPGGTGSNEYICSRPMAGHLKSRYT